MTLHVFFLFPETAGKTLEEVEEMFTQGIPAWKTGVGKRGATRDLETAGSSSSHDHEMSDKVEMHHEHSASA
jgi:hypothetical protein